MLHVLSAVAVFASANIGTFFELTAMIGVFFYNKSHLCTTLAPQLKLKAVKRHLQVTRFRQIVHALREPRLCRG